jgi:hypothetical protein
MRSGRSVMPSMCLRKFGSKLLLAVGAAALLTGGRAVVAAELEASAGENIFLAGVLPDGAPLRGERDAGDDVLGAAAACATCHRRSGLGSAEGRTVVPPIIGKYLFRPHATNVSDPNLPHLLGYRSTREPYTEETLKRAVRDGIAPNGRQLNYLMPRYRLDDATLSMLTAYLRELTAGAVPGVTDEELHFATIITPGVDAVARKAMLDVMQHFIADKNAFIRGGSKPMTSNSREVQYRVTRRWQLHVWDLSGPPEGWQSQLRAKLAADPVFAVLSGLGAGNWAPVHEFCEQARLPCLFPNVDEPKVREQDFYSIYFSRGVWLEADLMAARLKEIGTGGGTSRVVQVYRDGDIGQDAARALRSSVAPDGFSMEDRVLKTQGSSAEELRKALGGVDKDTALILWLRGSDLAALSARAPQPRLLLMSGLMGGLEEAPLPASWRKAATLTYPLDLPELRKIRMNYPLGWMRIHDIPVVAERVQVDTYIACGIVSEILNEMLDSFVRDYLIERTETMISHRLVNGYYPRLSLAPGQRFASKGGFMVHFAAPTGTQIVAEGDWTTP